MGLKIIPLSPVIVHAVLLILCHAYTYQYSVSVVVSVVSYNNFECVDVRISIKCCRSCIFHCRGQLFVLNLYICVFMIFKNNKTQFLCFEKIILPLQYSCLCTNPVLFLRNTYYAVGIID